MVKTGSTNKPMEVIDVQPMLGAVVSLLGGDVPSPDTSVEGSSKEDEFTMDICDYFSASYRNSVSGIWIEITNISAVDEIAARMKLDGRCAATNRSILGKDGIVRDSLKVWRQPYVLSGQALLSQFPVGIR